ncbi:DUF6270 domain-containing protein [Brevibacterium linens]|uniref:Uncharacterized protein n=1 Tax=Brevibacterium linens ATCC 9172 TaxID=1255617 RepID=A0A2H1JEK1_BRELN|nr:DUF6270 domain-containing protein [Brevibacterium linens]KAB1947899.1 hypothetical protein F8227_07645 [Brevibacterium linens ATCC 9172]SMX85916.1 hypothetical protein BLIN9172_02071 [Brevibacterium linens ATCC 9172]
MKVAIFGSCVSRDSAEFMPEAEVVVYVARHSVSSLESPHGADEIDLSELSSTFQSRMVTSDLNGSGFERIATEANDLDVVLLDLVDERRGFWQFTDGTSMTNSIEIEFCGAARAASRGGARLVEFGTDEHFFTWKSGYIKLIDGLKGAGLWEKTILLDIEWAGAVDGAQHPQSDSLAKLGRRWRRLQRGSREMSRSLSRGEGVAEALTNLRQVRPTEAEEYADRAAAANADYVRYREFARSMVSSTITRTSDQVRISKDHKWGPQPFHYRDEDYRSIVQSIRDLVENQDTSSTNDK